MILCDSDIEKSIKTIISQTNYTENVARDKLREFNNDFMKVLKDYMGIENQKLSPVKSINQEIYKQLRTNLDQTSKAYRDKNPINLEHAASSFNESDKNQINKNK